MNKGRGRPRGRPRTREHILDVARELFLHTGYRGTTVRSIAAAAGVDSALIAYHFGSKQGLFGESMNLICSRSPALTAAVAGDPAGLPDRLLHAVTDMWEGNRPGGLFPESMPAEEVRMVFQEFLERELLGRIAEYLDGPDATERATAAVVVIGGLVLTRYLNPLRPASSMPAADIRRILGPPLRAALQPRRHYAPAGSP